MRYRQAAYSPDAVLARMLDSVRAQAGSDSLSLVLNGDVFDFDAPRVINGESQFHDQPRTEHNAVAMLAAILDDHPVFVDALGRVVADGHELVVISGNHDAQLVFPGVRELLAERVIEAALKALTTREEAAPGLAALRERVVFRAWFHRTRDGILIEHGNQYDEYCALRYPMAPFGHSPDEVQPTLGSLASRNLLSRMGYFNPHVDSSFMLSLFGYLSHWARYYLFSRRSLAFAWMMGAIRTVATLIRSRHAGSRTERSCNVAAATQETGTPRKIIARHARLFARPSEDRLLRVARELWLDRFALSALVLVIATLWLTFAHGPLLYGVAVAPMMLLGYELAMPKPTLDDNWREVQANARKIARIHKAKAVVLGHTHRESGVWENGTFFGNCGSWSAAYRDIECTQPLNDRRPLVWLRSDVDGQMQGGLVYWVHDRDFLH